MRLCGISSRFQLLSPGMGQVTHALLTRPPLSQSRIIQRIFLTASLDLHVLSTPPAFILSQNRTLHKKNFMKRHRHDDSRNKKIDDRLIRKGASHKNLAAV